MPSKQNDLAKFNGHERQRREKELKQIEQTKKAKKYMAKMAGVKVWG